VGAGQLDHPGEPAGLVEPAPISELTSTVDMGGD
jgi:hypothetical protein